MSYKVLYRKYRPDNFDNVVGQDYTVKMLKNAIITGKNAHAYIFTGPRGTGKTSSAKIFAKALNCSNPIDGNPCNECEACRSFKDNPDIIEIDAEPLVDHFIPGMIYKQQPAILFHSRQSLRKDPGPRIFISRDDDFSGKTVEIPSLPALCKHGQTVLVVRYRDPFDIPHKDLAGGFIVQSPGLVSVLPLIYYVIADVPFFPITSISHRSDPPVIDYIPAEEIDQAYCNIQYDKSGTACKYPPHHLPEPGPIPVTEKTPDSACRLADTSPHHCAEEPE